MGKTTRMNPRLRILLVSFVWLYHPVMVGAQIIIKDDEITTTTIPTKNSQAATKKLAHQLKQSAAEALQKVMQEEDAEQQQQQQQQQQQEEDEDTLLDAFGHMAKRFLTQQFIPKTDSSCDWSWRTGRCEPFCHCQLQYQWGDYHLGRSCRLIIDKEEYEDSNDDDDDDDSDDDDHRMCVDVDPTVYALAITKIIYLQKEARHHLKTNIHKLQEQWGQFHQEFCHEEEEEEEKIEDKEQETQTEDEEKINLLLFPPDKFPNIVDNHHHRRRPNHPTKITTQSNPFKKHLQKVVCHNNNNNPSQEQYDLDKGRKQFVKFVNEQNHDETDEEPDLIFQNEDYMDDVLLSEK